MRQMWCVEPFWCVLLLAPVLAHRGRIMSTDCSCALEPACRVGAVCSTCPVPVLHTVHSISPRLQSVHHRYSVWNWTLGIGCKQHRGPTGAHTVCDAVRQPYALALEPIQIRPKGQPHASDPLARNLFSGACVQHAPCAICTRELRITASVCYT